MEVEQPIKQPWLSKNEVHDGKPRFVDMTLFNKEDEAQKVQVDRLHFERSNIDEDDIKDDENFNWQRFKKAQFGTADAQAMLEVLSDLNSHTLVALGKDRLADEVARRHIKIYKDYVKAKEDKAKRKDKKINDKENIESNVKVKAEPSSPKSDPEDVSVVKRDCNICQESCEDLNEHLILTHYKARILEEYPAKNFKCHFSGCNFLMFFTSSRYLMHIGIDHNVLRQLIDTDHGISTPKKSEKPKQVDASPETPKIKFKCPMCDTVDVTNARSHLSRHFADRVKEDFPFIKDENNGGFICPIADCNVEPMTSMKLVRHINLDHDQINVYLQDLDDVQLNAINGTSRSRGHKRKRTNMNLATPSKKSKMKIHCNKTS